jgi:PAS domain S-box-containing protein
LLGYTKEDIKTLNFASLLSEDDLLTAYNTMKDIIEGGVQSNFSEYRLKKKDGDYVYVESNGTLIYSDGKAHAIMGTARDITERKKAEEEKRIALEFAAEQSKNALIGQVAGKIAHDFNNVLMVIMSNSQLAFRYSDNDKTKEKLERIIEYSERGKNITNNLISYSKDQEPEQTYFKIEDKIDLVLKMLEKDLRGIKVNKNYKPRIPKLLADPGMIQDVIVNLVQNSIHAMSKVENPKLYLKVYSQDRKVYFEIEDNGCGIPKEHQESIYTPSFTLKGSQDKTRSYKAGIKGTGYGMSNIKKYIVEKHKGDISLKSKFGKGTKITIALRVIKGHLSLDEKKEILKSKIYDKRRILLVEDEHAIADVQYQILTKKPFYHIVSLAVNGQMAIDVFDRNKFDMVSLDYMLPGKIKGLDVYKHIREKDKDIPVMFISGNIEFLESMKKLKEKDPNLEHLSKPVNNLDYVNKINELIGMSIK